MKSNWKIMLISLLIGGFLGAAVSLAVVRYCRPDWIFNRSHHRMQARLYDKLQLSPEQKAQVQVILAESRAKLKKMMNERRPQFDAIRDEANSKIRKLLNAEQQIQFDVMNAKMEARLAKLRERRAKFHD